MTATPVGSNLSGDFAERFEVSRELGRGGMAVVLLAHDRKLDRPVALKLLAPEISIAVGGDRFLREIRVTARLVHPNIVPLFDSGRAGSRLYYVMPYIAGPTLRSHLVQFGPRPVDETIRILSDIAEALAYAHTMGIVHRDLKPENIFLVPGPDGKPMSMVTDFGLAKEKKAEPGMAKLTATGIILGTPEFMSPEQIRGKPLDGRSDIYALGLVAYELFSGRLPFEGRSAQDMMIARLRGVPLPLRKARAELNFTPEFEKALMKAIEVEPNDRYQSARELGDALHRAAFGGTGNTGIMGKLKGMF